MTIREATESDGIAWNAFLKQTKANHHAYRWEWRSIIAGVFGHRPYYLVAATDGNELLGVLPLFLVESPLFGRALISVPYLNAGGILAIDDNAAIALLNFAKELADSEDVKYMELRHRSQMGSEFDSLPCRTHKVAMLLPLASDPDAVFKSFTPKLRSQIRRPTKSGISTTSVLGSQCSAANVQDFYAVFSRNMLDLGTPVYPKRLFSEAANSFGDDLQLVCAYYQNTPVASGITIAGGDSTEIPWASSLREYNKLAPNMLLYWEAIKGGCHSQCRSFDFGRSTPDSGTFRFKQQWGAEPLTLHWNYYVRHGQIPDVNPKSSKFALAVKLWQHLPLPVANALGPWVTKGLP